MTSTVLFDMDGTLVDTAPDLGFALNQLRNRYGYPDLSDETIRPYASHGTTALLKLGFDITPQESDFVKLRDEYLSIYDEALSRMPLLFKGMDVLLDSLEKQNIQWGIVTNKPRRFTLPMVEVMGLHRRAAVIVSGDDAKPKPSPETLWLACEKLGVEARHCYYVGDAERDIVAGKAAGMQTVAALFGYLGEHDNPFSWQADYYIDSPEALIDIVGIPPIN